MAKAGLSGKALTVQANGGVSRTVNFGTGIGQGATALIANALGAKDTDRARIVFSQAIVFSIGAGIVLICLAIAAATRVAPPRA